MVARVQEYVGQERTVIVIEAGNEDLGPFVPFSLLSAIGEAIIQAQTQAAGRSIIGAAARGSNSDITALLGMQLVAEMEFVITPQGTASMSVLASALAPFFPTTNVEGPKTANYTVQADDGLILVDATAGGFALTVPRALGPKTCFVLKIGSDTNIVVIQDDLAVAKFALVQGGQAMAIVAVKTNVVYAGGSP